MNEETSRLVDRWIITFLEAPPFLDVELMTRLLAEHEADLNPGQAE
ncbi:hypothetical protein BH10PSE1_BH10PSE1_00310 [soil metagenome]